MKILKYNIPIPLLLFTLVCLSNTSIAQQGFGTANPNKDAVVDLTSSNKGLLMPRVALTAATNAAPLNVHLAGTAVYNTNTIADVLPSYYYNDGVKWNRLDVQSIANWNIENTSNKATSSTQNIYQMGKVGIGVNTPTHALHVFATANPLRIEGLKEITTNLFELKSIYVKPNDGIWKTQSLNFPFAYVKKTSSSQRFDGPTTFGSSSTSNSAVISFALADETTVDDDFVTLAGNEFTILADGFYDVYCTTNLISDVGNSANAVATDYTARPEKFMSVNLKLQKSTGGGAFTDVVSTVNLINVSNRHIGVTTGMTPILAILQLAVNDKLRLVINRQDGGYTTTCITGAVQTEGIRTSGTGNGVTNSKMFRIFRIN